MPTILFSDRKRDGAKRIVAIPALSLLSVES